VIIFIYFWLSVFHSGKPSVCLLSLIAYTFHIPQHAYFESNPYSPLGLSICHWQRSDAALMPTLKNMKKGQRCSTTPPKRPSTAVCTCHQGLIASRLVQLSQQKLSPELEPLPSPVTGETLLLEPDEGPSFVQEPAHSLFTGAVHASASFSHGPIESSHIAQLALHQSAGMQASLAALEAESHATRLAQAKKEQGDKSTGTTYQRHIKRYEQWWVRYQVEQAAEMPGLDSDPGIPHHCRKGGHVFGIRGHPREGMCSSLCLASYPWRR